MPIFGTSKTPPSVPESPRSAPPQTRPRSQSLDLTAIRAFRLNRLATASLPKGMSGHASSV